jgi:Bacterial Ig-like domain (group 2)/PQQ-like domain
MDATECSFSKYLLVLAFFLPSVGCASLKSNSGSTPPPKSLNVSIQLSQSTVSLQAGAKQQFSAVVEGSSDTKVKWSVDNIAGGNSASGTIDATGLYTAPMQAGTHTVTATSAADASKNASATVTVVAVVSDVSIAPASTELSVGATQQFSATVQGQSTSSVTWSVDGVSGGSSSGGTITSAGLYTAPPVIGNHTVSATYSGNPSGTANATVTVFALSMSPDSALVLPGATQQFTATLQGLSNASVTWSVDGISGGNNSVGTIDFTGLYTAPNATGQHTITATVESASAQSTLTVLNQARGAVLTYHNDDARDGTFTEETTLTPSVVNSSQFGKLFSYPVDGQIYAQPLYVPQLSIKGSHHDVVFVATENDSVYAFDADQQSEPLWQVSLGVPSPRNDVEGISPELGITSTPVIDITTGTLYVLTTTNSGPFYLHALDITSGAEKLGGPVAVRASATGTGWDSSNGKINLEAGCYQRLGLALNPVTNQIYVGFGHCNHGWLLAYDKTSLQQKAVFNDTPDGAGGGLWNGGGAPAINDLSGHVYIMTGVDQDDPPSGYNDSFLRLSSDDLSVQDFFQPDNAAYLSANDADLGSGSLVLMPDNSSSTPYEVIGGGKDGRLFVVNRANMGSFSADSNNVIQTVQTGVQQFDNIFSTPVYWNGFLYIHCETDVLRQFSWNNGLLSEQPVNKGQIVAYAHGATASLSANGTKDGILWEIDNSSHNNGGPAILRAYDATDVSKELYDSAQAGARDTAGVALKFTVPTIARGKVLVGTSNELDIYGLLTQ